MIVASATLDAEVFARYFDPAFGTADATAAILSIPGTMHPVELAYAAAPVRDYVTAAIDAVWSIHLREPPGDVFVFMTGREEIDAASQALADRVAQLPRGALTLHILPLHAALSVGEQAAAFAPSPRGTRKVVVATNVAETSLTIDGIRYVVDTGYTKTRLIDAATGIDVLAVVPASQASAAQRAGRAGRTAPGKCFRLYPEAQLAKQRVSDAPELVRCDVTPYVLQLKALGIDNIARFDFVPPAPPAALIARALEYLVCVQALDSEGRLQRLGERLAEAPLDPMMARALLVAAQCGCADEMLSIAAMTAVASPFRAHEFGPTMDVAAEVGRRKFVAEEGDHLTLLNVYDAFVDPRIGQCSARWAASHALDVSVLRRAQAIRAQLVRYATLHWQLPLQRMGDATRLRRCLAAGFFKNAARAMPDGTYQSVHGTALHIHPSSVLFTRRTAAWVVYGELVHTSKPMIRDVCVVERDWLVEAAPHYYEKRQRY